MAGAKHPHDEHLSPGRSLAGHVDDWEELAADYVDGALDPESRAAVQAHLDACADCAKRLDVQKNVSALLHETPLEDGPADLEDRVMGEMLFPKTPARSVKAAAAERARWSNLWRRRIRPWIPATVAVAALFAALISFGLLHGTAGRESMVTTTAGAVATTTAEASGRPEVASAPSTTATTAAPATTAGASVGAGVPAAGQADTSAPAPTFAAAATTTTTAGSPPTESPVTEAPNTMATRVAAGTSDTKTMIADLQQAGAPLYFVFAATASGDESTSSTDGDDQAKLAEQITQLTGLQPVSGDLSLDGTTFAAYVRKKDATAIVELLQSIGNGLQLTVTLASQPLGAHAQERAADYGALLEQQGAAIPELTASTAPQPSVAKYAYATSTVATDGQIPADWLAPDGTHALIVVYLGE